ncbi:hypothetical protein OE09_0975 [Flavobacteriaceae bacterium MAR_2010_72]|nr:hypothetical protein OE09_0975 [Flavobacteriaceae bacterium MAR_2010_72]TVZ60222.1 hypothetical protein NA63_2773 [Flavobacteriaceae bacterium MAR_2010_105]
MKKSGVIIGVIIVVVIALAFTLDYNRNKVIDWTESYNEKSNKPYGISVLYKELPKLFKGHKMRTVYHTPSNYLYANSEDGYGDHVAFGSYLIIGNSDYLEYDDILELLRFTSTGNTLFISDYDLPKKLLDTLNIAIDSFENIDSIANLQFNYRGLEEQHTQIDRSFKSSYFSKYSGENYQSLGYLKNDRSLSNFLEVPFEDGYIYLHLEPKVFTNYNLLKNGHYTYVEGVLSYLPDDNLYFDSFTKYYDSYYGDVQEKSDLSWFLEQTSFKWAWYTALILTLLFIIFNARRRQRVINIIKPLENTTVGFVKTISNLYFETQDHKNLIDKKIIYFLEKIRTDYHMDTSILNEEFISTLASKSGKKTETVKKLINFIKWLRTKNDFFEDNLIKLNKHIEDFYSK